MDIFKDQAKKNESGTDTQRGCMESAQAKKVVADKAEQTIGVPTEAMMTDNDDLRTTKELEVYYPSNNATTNNRSPAIIRKDDGTPTSNTRASRRHKILSAENILGSCPTAKQSELRFNPLQFLADFAGAILDNETGKLLEYRHIIKRQKYNNIGPNPLGMRLEYYHKEWQAKTLSLTQSYLLTKVTFQIKNGKLSTTS